MSKSIANVIKKVNVPRNKFNTERSAFNFKPAKILAPEIVHNPAQSSPSLKQTPRAFLPDKDPRKNMPINTKNMKVYTPEELENMPLIMGYSKEKTYTITPKIAEEMKTLRSQDPHTWTINKLAKKFEIDPVKVNVVTGFNMLRKLELKAEYEAQFASWHPHKQQARLDRKKRVKMWLRNEY